MIWFNETNAKLANIANVNRETYRQAKRVLDSDNEDLKQRVLSGETAISTGYKELVGKKLVGKKENKKVEDNNVTTTTIQTAATTPNNSISIKEAPKPIVENGVILI